MKSQIIKIIAYYKVAANDDDELHSIIETLEDAAVWSGNDVYEDCSGVEKINFIASAVGRDGVADANTFPVLCGKCDGTGGSLAYNDGDSECEKCEGTGYTWQTK